MRPLCIVFVRGVSRDVPRCRGVGEAIRTSRVWMWMCAMQRLYRGRDPKGIVRFFPSAGWLSPLLGSHFHTGGLIAGDFVRVEGQWVMCAGPRFSWPRGRKVGSARVCRAVGSGWRDAVWTGLRSPLRIADTRCTIRTMGPDQSLSRRAASCARGARSLGLVLGDGAGSSPVSTRRKLASGGRRSIWISDARAWLGFQAPALAWLPGALA
ncbi:hypothetical protein DFH07DRAFT_509845 [Mycena maculata]|uniref:Uncharacterized protein n=1 Tax=Mycena maculata TaxID=230809 RepID=A0AAD7IZJ4_9AGAR|nr:hypothetical protein DFH07DRAFT_509845 [Mycena maculata]